jgi:O-methyltransferase involved in polyketide biosynthesis
LAAGLDTRAFRLDWPVATRLFELDRPQLLEAKDQLLAAAGARPACDQQTVGADLLGAWTEPLQGSGFRPEQPACWLAEGVVVYLTDQQARDVLRQLSEVSAAGSRLGLDVPNRAFLTSDWTRQLAEAMARRGAPYRFATDEPESLLAEFGWTAEATQLGGEDANYGRWPYPVLPRGALGDAEWVPRHRHEAGVGPLGATRLATVEAHVPAGAASLARRQAPLAASAGQAPRSRGRLPTCRCL